MDLFPCLMDSKTNMVQAQQLVTENFRLKRNLSYSHNNMILGAGDLSTNHKSC